MKTTIGVYDSHDDALDAILELKQAGFPMKNLSVIGKAEVEVVDDEMHVMPKNPLDLKGVGIGTTLGAALGILTGVGLFAIPGLGFLYGAGALVGAIAGIDFGLIGGGIATVLTTVGVGMEETKRYQENLAEGKYLLVAQGNEQEVQKAMEIMDSHGKHTYAAIH